VLAKCGALFLVTLLPCFAGFARIFWTRGNIRKDLAFMAARFSKPAKSLARIPGVYPYSVVPGGVKDAADLRYKALRDWVVRRHYAHFDFSHARLERVTEAREVYLSYRVRDAIFWTRRRIRLHLGELAADRRQNHGACALRAIRFPTTQSPKFPMKSRKRIFWTSP